MGDTYSGLTLAVRPHPGSPDLLELGVEVDGGFYGIQLLKTGRFNKIIDAAKARQEEEKAASTEAAAGTPPSPPAA